MAMVDKMAATEKKWYVGEDGCISVCELANSVTYHSALNSLIVSTREPSIKVYDVASGALLKKSSLSAKNGNAIKCLYLPERDRILFSDDYALGVRSDLRGMLLLDTALQTPVARQEDEVKVEIPLAEGTQLLKSLVNAELPGVEHVEDIVRELEKAIDTTQETTKGNLKTAKWATVNIVLPHCVLKGVCSSLVTEMKRLNLYTPGLSVASAIIDRLNYLQYNVGDTMNGPVERVMMYSEAARRETFRKWPHMNYKWALPDPMAQAGFYHQPNSIGDDRAMCFTCNVCLVCWEPTDEPWSEHERHSPSCPFVKGEYTQNVPLSVTYASQPAKIHGEKTDKIECLSTTNIDDFVATSTLNGRIVVWKVDRLLKKYCQFNLDPTETAIAVKTGIQIERNDDKEVPTKKGQKETPEGAEGIPCDNTDAKLDLPGSSGSSQSEDPVYEIPLHEKVDKTEITKTRTRPSEDVRVKSICLLQKKATDKPTLEKETNNEKAKKKSRTHPQPTLVCGVSIRRTKMSLSNVNLQNPQSEIKPEVQLMNKVNEVVSSDSHPRIISENELQDDSCQDDLVSATSFIPYLLVTSTKDNRRKSTKNKENESKKLSTSVSTSSLNVPTLGSISMDHDWGILDPMFDSDPDPDCHIVGVTPGPTSLSVESPTGTKVLSEDLSKSQTSLSEVSVNSKSLAKPKAGTVLQCIELPVEVQSENLEVTGIMPTFDGQHLIVTVTPVKTAARTPSFVKSVDSEIEGQGGVVSESDISLTISKEGTVCNGGCIIIYRVNYSDDYVRVEENPVLCKFIDDADNAITSVLVLPNDVSGSFEEEEDRGVQDSVYPSGTVSAKSKNPDIHGQFCVTLAGGKFWLLNICDLQIIAEVSPPEFDKFVSATYCMGIERLCVCTSGGKLHFYQLCEHSPPQPDLLLDLPEEVCNGEVLAEVDPTTSSSDTTDSKEVHSSPGADLLVNQQLNLDNLVSLHNIIQFENLMPRFTATVPPCWTEIQQEQQQRRHPQHLQHQGEATQHTRTWKLQPDGNTWDEHLFEIVLPRPCYVGHVDLKFSLHPGCTTPPDVQVTLLKQNITSIGRQASDPGRQTNDSGVDVDKVVDFNMVKPKSNSSDSTKNDKTKIRILDKSFLESHNAVVLCGPVNISQCLDLSGNGGLVTLTSPQLLSSKPKAFLLHVKGFIQNVRKTEEKSDKQKEPKKKMPMPSAHSSQKMKVMKTAFDKDLFMPHSVVKETNNVASVLPRPRYTENFKGCDWIQELSITIRKTKKSWLPKERLQRSAMLDNSKFHDKLLLSASLSDNIEVSGVGSDHWQNMVLDILMWISAVQMNDPVKRHISSSLPVLLQKRLNRLVKACFVQGTRTTAHKCARLLTLCMEYCKLSSDPDMAPNFSISLLHALLESLPLLPCAMSAGAVKWFFIILNRVKCMDVGTVAHDCTDLLLNTSRHYSDRMSPLHSLLKARFGLYGQPFDADLFDTELPMAMRQPVPTTSYASVASSGIQSSSSSGNNNNNMTTASAAVSCELDFYDLFNPPSEKSMKLQLEYAKSNIFGLLEVEPLHFSCHSTSDGTKMERYDTSSVSGHGASVNPVAISGTINFGEAIPAQSTSLEVASANANTLANLSSSMAVTKQHLQELSTKTYPTFKHKIMHIKQILSEVGKSLPQESMVKYTSDQLFPPTPKTTPQVMTPSLTPPNEIWQQNQSMTNGDKLESSSAFIKQSLHQQQQSVKSSPVGFANSQTLLQQPPLQVLVIERMHSGARRFVILDFGKPIVLTDVIIPACADLASLSIDVWVQGEEIDGQRLIVASDIGLRSLIMNDIMPATVCRYLKITTIGRYGSGSTRSKIPIGAFYGHSCILPWEWNSYIEQRCTSSSLSSEAPTQNQLVGQLGVYMSLLEDIQCRYSLARTRLETLLASVDTQQYSSSHIQYFLKKNKKTEDDSNIIEAYQDCLQLQLQQNLAQRAINRLHTALGFKIQGHHHDSTLTARLRQACTDKLRFLQENLLDTLLSMTSTLPSIPQPPMSLYTILSPQTTETLFKYLCVHGTKKIQISTGMLLMRVCGSQPWWGNFLGNVLEEFFHSENTQTFAQDRVFVLLLAMGQKALSGQCAIQIMDSLLEMLARVLSPLISGQQNVRHYNTGMVDLTLVGWILLFLCRSLDPTTLSNISASGDETARMSRRETEMGALPNRWNFIQGDHNTLPNKSKVKSSKLYRWSMHKRLQHHKQKLMDLQQAQKTFFASQAEKTAQSASLLKQQEKQFKKELSQYTSKHIKDIIHMRRTDVETLRKMNKTDDGSGSSKTNGSDSYDSDVPLVLPKEKVLRVVKGLMALLLNMDFTCNVDLFLVTCKVLATICLTTRPAITLPEAMTQEQLEGLILLASNLEFSLGNISWGGPWASHAITSLLQDILDGEKIYPAQTENADMSEECINTEMQTDDSLTQSISLPTLEETEPDPEPSSIETTDMDLSEGSDPPSKMFDKESSLMVDLLLDDGDFDDDTSAKLHAYVTGENVKPPTMVFSNYEQPTSTVALNGTVDSNSVFTTGDDNKKFTSKLTAQINKHMQDKGDKSSDSLLTTANKSGLTSAAQGMSTALDARLEFGLETQAELGLKVMSSLHAENVQQAFSTAVPVAPSVSHTMEEQSFQPSTDDELSEANGFVTQTEVTSSEMLSQCYEHLFSSIMPRLTNLDALLQLWLTLNCEGSLDGNVNQVTFDPSRVPLVPLSKASVSRLLELVANTASLPVCTWVLVLQTLTLLANQKIPHQIHEGAEQSMVIAMLSDSNMIAVIKNFLTGTSDMGPVSSAAQFTQVGPSATKSFYEFLLRLQVKCAPENLCNLKDVMLKLVYTLCVERGAIHCGLGPLDAQCKFLDFILDMTYDQVEISNAVSVIQSISMLVHQHIICQERILCRSSSENSVNARSCFGGLFSSLLRGGDSRSTMGDVSRDLLMSSLLRLVNSVLQIKRVGRNSRLVSVILDNTVEPLTPTNISMFEPVPDSTKLCQALATSTPTSAFALSDEERGHQTDEQKTENLNERRNGQPPPDTVNSQLADIILSHTQIMCNFIEALSYCNSSTLAAILGSRIITSQMQETFTGGDPVSVGDGIYQILLMLSRNCSDQRLILDSVLQYLSGSHRQMLTSSLFRLSEPLLWFILKILDTPNSIQTFVEMGGIEVVCRNLVSSNCRIISTSPSLISTIMQNLNGKSRAAEKRIANQEVDSVDGLQNFAPLGSVSSSSPTASPADILIQAAPTHRRARSAAWSYRFYPDEAWVDLTVQLPFAVLLKEVQIQQYSTSLTTCPAYVSLEISHDGVTTKPLCHPLLTSSLACIKLQLQRPEVATTVIIRLHKARDSMTIGLSKIRVLGTNAFGDAGFTPQNVFLPADDFVSKSSVRWIRLLHHCLTEHKEMEDRVAAAAATTPNLLNTCSALLVSPLSSVYAHNIEAVLLKMGLHSVELGLTLIDNILRNPLGQSETGSVISPFLGKVSGLANDSTVELLYQLGTVQDSGTHHRVKALLEWLGDSARIAMQKTAVYSDEGYRRIPHQTLHPSLPSPAPSHIHCISAILWQSYELPIQYNLTQLITKDLVSSLFEWSVILKVDSALKKSVDYLLCVCCHIKPESFSQLLTWMGVITTGVSSMTASISDDRKDSSQIHERESNSTSLTASVCDDRKDISNRHQNMMTDDSKEANCVHIHSDDSESRFIEIPQMLLQEFRHISLEEAHLSTLALACKSSVAVKHLLDSGFPAVLAQGLFEFCSGVISRFSDSYVQPEVMTDTSKTMSDESSGGMRQESGGNNIDKVSWITTDMVAAVLNFFAEVSSEPQMKEWMGGAEGNIFWPALLTMLCNMQTASIPKTQNASAVELLSMDERTSIETAAVRFFTQVISCHIVNQLLFAKILCEVIKEQSSCSRSAQGIGNLPLSGFTRCLFLQALLEDEKILVVLKLPQQSNNLQTPRNNTPLEHPKYSGGREYQGVIVSLHTTCSELLAKVTDTPSLPEQFLERAAEKSDEARKDLAGQYAEMTDFIATGIVAKERREKDEKEKSSGKSSLPPRPPTRRGRHTADTMASQLHFPVLKLYHSKLPNKALPGDMTLSQLLQTLHQQGLQQGHSVLEFSVKVETKPKDTTVTYLSGVEDWETSVDEEVAYETLLSSSSFPTSLQVFASVGGLALLAEHLPLLYPEISRQPLSPDVNALGYCKTVSNSADLGQDWVTVEPFPEEFYELYEPVSPAPAVSRTANPAVSMPSIPPHSLIAFGLFLRLPGYAEVLLKERKKAQCLLRLVLGVTDDGDGGHILTSPIASSLPTLPFLVLKALYDGTPLTTDDGVLLRRMSLEIWVIHLILACLSVLSHHAPRVNMPGFQQEAQLILSAMQNTSTPNPTTIGNSTEEKSQQYWAKGTGFGTGSTTSSWDAEQALLRQKSEEEHVTCLFQVLASYINPGGDTPKDFDSVVDKVLIPNIIPDLFSQSCLVPSMSSYLRNDSVLDMARHIPLYRALLELLRGISVCPSLVPLLLPLDKENNTDSTAAVGVLLDKMRGCVDTYISRLKSNKGKNGNTDEEENEGLTLLIPDIQETARIVKLATDRLQKSTESGKGVAELYGSGADSQSAKESLDEKYMEIMKELQFDTYEMVLDEGNGVQFTMSHHYENNVKAAGDVSNAARTRRLAQEAVTLSTSLPLSAGSSVFVRCDEERLDVMKVLITGPDDTPYDNGCFEFDVYFPQDYPNSPPFINLETTGNHTVRFNPNLYNDGKVCLSVLNTWHGRPEEKWNSQTSSFLQVLVSIQSLILVSEPYFNEPGYERSRGTPSGTASSREYDANIRQATVKWAMLEQLKNPSACFKEVIHKHFWLKRHEVLKQCEDWIAEMESYSSDKRTGRNIAHSTLALKRHYNQLREEIAKLKPPSGSGDDEEDIDPNAMHYSTDSTSNVTPSTTDTEVPGPSSQPDSNVTPDANSNSVLEDGFV